MVKKYIAVRFPKEAYENLQRKKKRMEEVVRQITGKQQTIPLTKVIIALSNKPLTIHDDSLLKLIRKKRIIKLKKVKVIQ